jgi:adenylosuccinate lyase
MPDFTLRLTALSLLDGRYAAKVAARLPSISASSARSGRRIEIAWLCAVRRAGGPKSAVAARRPCRACRSLHRSRRPTPRAVKCIERETNHDVKAVEYFLKARLGEHAAWHPRLEFVHFACTSEDINNLAYALLCREAREQVLLPHLDSLADALRAMAHAHADDAMMSRTHGQPATPGGKESPRAHRWQVAINGSGRRRNGAVGTNRASPPIRR